MKVSEGLWVLSWHVRAQVLFDEICHFYKMQKLLISTKAQRIVMELHMATWLPEQWIVPNAVILNTTAVSNDRGLPMAFQPMLCV